MKNIRRYSNWVSKIYISSLVLKYLILYVLSQFLSLKKVGIFICMAILLVDVIVGFKEKESIFRKEISTGIYLLKLYFWFIVVADIYLFIHYLIEHGLLQNDIGELIILLIFISLYIYILVITMLLPIILFIGNKKWKNMKSLKKLYIFCLEFLVLLVINELLLAGEDIILAVFSGVVVVFVKWLYSEEGLYFFVKDGIYFEKDMISDDIRLKFKRNQGWIVIALISLSVAVLIKKLYFKKNIVITLIGKMSYFSSLPNDAISSIFIFIIAVVLGMNLKNFIMNPENPITKMHQEEIAKIATKKLKNRENNINKN